MAIFLQKTTAMKNKICVCDDVLCNTSLMIAIVAKYFETVIVWFLNLFLR